MSLVSRNIRYSLDFSIYGRKEVGLDVFHCVYVYTYNTYITYVTVNSDYYGMAFSYILQCCHQEDTEEAIRRSEERMMLEIVKRMSAVNTRSTTCSFIYSRTPLIHMFVHIQ